MNNPVFHHSEAHSRVRYLTDWHENLTNVLGIAHKHMQCSLDGQKQLINYISLREAEICFHILYYPPCGSQILVCFASQ